MKRSAAVPLTLAATLSAGLGAGCASKPEPMQCVEKSTGRVMPDSVCTRAGVAPGTAAPAAAPGTPAVVGSHTSGVPWGLYGWYYGGRIARGFVTGGSYEPLLGRRYRSYTGGTFYRPSERSGGAVGSGGWFGGRSSGAGSAARGSVAPSGVSRGGFGSSAGRFGGGFGG